MRSIFDVQKHDDYADGVLKLVKGKLDIIFRLRWPAKRRTRPVYKPLAISDVAAVDNASLSGTDEEFLLVNARQNRRIAMKLHLLGFHRDAYLAQHLALEMALKVVLAKATRAYRAKYLDELPSDGKEDKPHLSHDLVAILKLLTLLVRDLIHRDSTKRLLQALATHKIATNWSSARYLIDPMNSAAMADFAVNFIALRRASIAFADDLTNEGVFGE